MKLCPYVLCTYSFFKIVRWHSPCYVRTECDHITHQSPGTTQPKPTLLATSTCPPWHHMWRVSTWRRYTSSAPLFAIVPWRQGWMSVCCTTPSRRSDMSRHWMPSSAKQKSPPPLASAALVEGSAKCRGTTLEPGTLRRPWCLPRSAHATKRRLRHLGGTAAVSSGAISAKRTPCSQGSDQKKSVSPLPNDIWMDTLKNAMVATSPLSGSTA
jgi:hypothetical protein